MKGEKRITVICGHYGTGKTNLALNLAFRAAEEGEKVTLVDLDIVNPYFRSSEYAPLLESRGIRLIAPVFAGTTLDTPALSPELYSIFHSEGDRVFIDAGGDDAGAVALGGLSAKIKDAGYEMLYVINHYRALSQTPEETAKLLEEIEAASRLSATGIVNNSHLGLETRVETLLSAIPYARETAALTGLPLLYNTAPDFVSLGAWSNQFAVVIRYVRLPWEQEKV